MVSGLCHYCTMGLPPEKLFYLYIPVGCLDLSLLLGAGGQRRSLQCLRSEAVSVILFHWPGGAASGHLPYGETFLTDLLRWLEVELCVCFVCIYETPYNISTYFIRHRQTGVLQEWDNPYIFFGFCFCFVSHEHLKTTLRPVFLLKVFFFPFLFSKLSAF